MPPRSNVPIRIGGSKSRSGCRTCKQRHVKCDEQQPNCLRCRRAGRQCFYAPSPAPSSTLQPAAAHGQEAGSTSLVASQRCRYMDSVRLCEDISLFGTRKLVEVNAAQHFAAHVGRDLAGCFSDEVWRQILPQVAQHEPAIWHGMVAVGMLDTTIRLSHNRTDEPYNTDAAIEQYTKALQELNRCLRSVDDASTRNVVLLSCILFAVFECLQKNFQSALQHISGGMKLLMQWESESKSAGHVNTRGYLDYKSLQPIFFSLDSQAVQMGIVSFRNYFSLPAIKNQAQTPTIFATAEEAHLVLNQIFYRLSRWGNSIEFPDTYGNTPSEEWIQMEERTLRTQLTEWDAAFTTLLKLVDQQAAILLLWIQRKVLQMFFEKDTFGRSEIYWDNVLPMFRETVRLAERYMEMTVNDRQLDTVDTGLRSWCPNRPRPIFTVAMDIVLSLWMMSAKCRESTTRRRALKMLKECGRSEGVWDSYLSAVVVEKMIDLEESGASVDGHIPEQARVFGLDVRLGDGRTADIVYKRLVQGSDGSQRVEGIPTKLVW